MNPVDSDDLYELTELLTIFAEDLEVSYRDIAGLILFLNGSESLSFFSGI